MKSFLTGKKTLDSEPLRSPHAHRTAMQVSGVVRPAATGPNVEVVKQGDKVVRLVIRCTCGEVTEIDCLYPAGS